jgi:selenocysteine-specific elongation factor
MIIATAGHVDHGKTLLVKNLTGIDTDRLEDEKARGLTIDLGFAYEQMDSENTLGFVDVPGHIKFIRNMLAGVGAIDHALLVIAADDGPMPQTLEHLDILDLLGITQATIAVTKIDRVSQQRVDEVIADIESLVQPTGLKNAPFYPVSGTTGEGIQALKDHLVAECKNTGTRSEIGNFRLAIDRCFTIKGSGLVVTGSVFSGKIRIGDELLISPQNISVRVRGIHTQNKIAEQGSKGDRCAINITGPNLNRDLIHRGNWLLAPRVHAPVMRLDARISVLDTEARPLRHWTPVHVHTGANHITGNIAILTDRQISPGDNGLVQLVLNEPVSTCRGDRVIVRDQAATRTIGGGQVIDPFSPRRGRAKQKRIAHLQAMEVPGIEDCLTALLKLHDTGVNLTQFSITWNLTQTEQNDLFGPLVDRLVQVTAAGQTFLAGFSEQHWRVHKQHIIEALTAWHQNHKEQLGAAEKQLLASMRPVPWPAVFALALSELISARQVMKSGSYLHIPGHSASLTPPEMKIWQALEPLIRSGGLKPPVVHELSNQSRIPAKQLEQFLKRATQLGLLTRVVKNRSFLPETVAQLGQLAENLAAQQEDGQFTASEYRDVTGIGRNLAIEVLEYFDGTGFTQRQGDKRRLSKT